MRSLLIKNYGNSIQSYSYAKYRGNCVVCVMAWNPLGVRAHESNHLFATKHK